MANLEQLEILKQGVSVWNEWRVKNHVVEIDLSRANLEGADLLEANLRGTNLSRSNLAGVALVRANLRGANLSDANLGGAYLREADFKEANLRASLLTEADLRYANLNKADLMGANLTEAKLIGTNLVEADLRDADLTGVIIKEGNYWKANFSGADFSEAVLSDVHLVASDFSHARMGGTFFGNCDMTDVIGLEDVLHLAPSIISGNTFAFSAVFSAVKIPEVFLRGCGLSDWEIEEVKLYNPDLTNDEINNILYKMYDLRASRALQISPLFVSYSHADGLFVDRLGVYLTNKGIRYWRDIHDMKAGRIEKQIDRAIRQNPTLLLILSEHSLKSDWVEHEVRTARELEKQLGRDVLCPVALDYSWMSSPWPKRIMEQVMEYNILDFSAWEDDSKFDGMFRKLINGLELFYKG